MTYCVGILLRDGIVLASDSRTNAGVDNFATFCKMTVFERVGDRVLVLLSSGNLAGTQAVISVLKQRAEVADGTPNLWTARTMFDVAVLVSDAMRDIERRDAPFLESGPISFNASFIVGGQVKGEPPRLFRIYAEGNFIEAGDDTPFLQTGEAKYGKPIIDRVIAPTTSLADATAFLPPSTRPCATCPSVCRSILVCYDGTASRSQPGCRQRYAYFTALSADWSEGVRKVFRELPELEWTDAPPGAASTSNASGQVTPNKPCLS
jgi:putative proteasome-type protease